MPIFNVPGRGRVQLPDGYTQEEYALAISKLSGTDKFQPEFSMGQKAFAPIARTLQNIGTSLTTELPAMGLAAIGKDEAARELLGEAKQRYAETERMAPRMYQSYEDVTGPLSALGFAYERAGEALPYGLAMLLPGGAAAAGARGIATRAGAAATEAALARGLPASAAESLGAARATQVMQRAGLGGAGVGGYALNAPETFAKVAEETGELRPGVAATAALGQTFLDLVAPSAFLSKLGMFGKLKAGEEVAKRAGFTEAAKDLAIAAAKTAPKEGLTEAAQEVIGNAAVDFVHGSGDLFSPERIKQYIEAGLSGAVGGGALGAAGRGIQRIGMPVEQPVEQPAPPQQVAVAEPQITQPETTDPLLKYQIPPMGGITPETVTDQALTPQPSSVGYQVPPETFTETPVDQKYFQQFVADIMAGVPRQAPEDQQFYANNAPAIEQRLREAQAAPALPAPTVQPTGDLNIPVPQAEVLQLAAPEQVVEPAAEQVVEEGPPEFVEPPPMEGPAPLTEEDQKLADEISELEKQADEIYTRMEAVQARERKRKSQGDTFLNALKKAGVSAKDVADIRRTQSDKNLDKAVVSGLLDPWLGEYSSVAVDRADVFDQKMKQNEAVEYLKDRILNFDYVSDTTKAELADLDLKLADVLIMIREFRSELEANLEAAEAADEQRVVYEQVEQAIPEGEEGAAELGEAARPEREDARAEVAFTPQSYAEQMMEGTLPDTDEAYAYFQENQQEIEQALADLEERRAQPMMKASTPEFKRWFGDSKVVGPDGRPKVMYHGTSRSQAGQPFSKFDVYASNYGLMGMGGYFTDNADVASEYTSKGRGETPTVYPVFLSIKTPMDMDGVADANAWKQQFDGIENYHEGGNSNESWYRAAEAYMEDQQVPKYEGAEALQDAIRNMGYDGITHIGGGRVKKEGVKHRVYIAFDPSQIKSVYNVGTFDPKREEISYMKKATAGQSKTSQTHADNLGGVVVWQDGDLALIRAHALLTGDPVYVVANGSFRSRTDVENYTGNLINAPQKARLVAAKEALEKKDKALHDKSPFIKFDADGVAMSQSISPELAGVIAGWKKLLKIPQGVYVTTMDDIVANRGKFTGPHRTIGSAALSDDLGSMRKMPDGNYYIAFTKDASVTRTLETLAHELGHIHERESFRNADLATQRSIRDEFDKFLNSSKGKSAKDYIESMRARGVGKTTQAGEKTKFEDLTPYWKSFGEWYADQVSRWATTSEKPLTVVERFFKRLADALKSFYAKVRNQKYLPNETFKQYMDKVTASVKDIAPVRVEAKPLGVKDQMALFMRAAMSQFDTPEFKRWFGDSKVVGSDGQPLPMYHGTNKNIQTFRGGRPMWFARDTALANMFTAGGRRKAGERPGKGAVVYPVYLHIKNPLDLSAMKPQTTTTAVEVLRRAGFNVTDQNLRDMAKSSLDSGDTLVASGIEDPVGYVANMWRKSMPLWSILDNQAVVGKIQELGYDGIKMREFMSAGRGRNMVSVDSDTYAVFEPNQIKSVYNVGTFDPSTDEIQYMRRSVEGLTDAGKDLSPQEQQDLFNAVDKIDDTPAEGMKSMDTMIKDTPSFEATKEKLGQYVKDATADNAQTLLQFLNLRQIAELAKKDLPQVRQYYDVLNQMMVERDKKLTTASKLREKWDQWADKHPKLGEALDKVILDARMSGIDPTIPEKEAKIKSESFRKNWEMIKGTEGETIFKELRDYYKTQLNDKREILKRIITTKITDVNERAKSLRELDYEFQKFESDGPYFPLSRFGQYFIAYNIKLPNGGTKPYHEMFESMADLRKHEESIAKDVASGKIINLKSGVDTKELFTEGVIKSAFINKIFAAIDKTDQPTLSDSAGRAMDLKNRLKDDVYQAYLSMLPELSVQKNFIHAKKVAGASLDMRRAFADSAFHSAYNLARMEFGPTLDAIISEAQRYSDSQKGVRNIARDRYLQELKAQHSDFSNPKDVHPVWSKITNFAFLYYLTAPASALGNLIQTPVIGIPTLAGEFDVSFARASKGIFKAFSDLKSSRKKGTAQYDLIGMLEKQAKASGSAKLKEEAEIMSELEGLTNQTQTLSLAGLAERPSSLYATGFKSIIKSKSLGVLDKASMILGYGFNLAEIANRQVTALAVVRLAQSKGMNKSQTIQLAREMIRQIHFEYAKETKARFLRHPIAQVTLQFKNYAQQMTAFIAQAIKDSLPNTRELNALLLKSQDKGLSEDERYAAKREYDELTRIKKAARKRLTGVMGMTALFAGYEGLPFYYIIEGVMNLIFDDEDDPYDFSLELKVAMANAFGDNVSRALSKGPMSEILQVDVSRFANLNSLWFRDDAMAKDEEEWAKNMLIDMLGPAAGIVLNVAGGIKKINEGNYARGMEEISPPVVKDFFKAWRFYHEGATTLRGDPIVPNVGLWGVFAQSLGFTPQDLQRGYEAMGEIKSLDKQLAQREQRLLSKLFLAYKSGDYEEMDDIGEQIIRYNSKNPGNEIDDKKIKRSFAQRERMSERAEKGIIVSAKRPELLEKTVYLED